MATITIPAIAKVIVFLADSMAGGSPPAVINLNPPMTSKTKSVMPESANAAEITLLKSPSSPLNVAIPFDSFMLKVYLKRRVEASAMK